MARTILPDGSLDPADDFEDDGGTPAFRERQRRNADYLRPMDSRTRRPGPIGRFRKLPVMHQIGWLAIFPPIFFFSAATSTMLFAYNFDIEPIGGLVIFLALFVPGAWIIIRRRRPRSAGERR